MPKTKGAKTGIIGNNINQKQFESLCKMMCTEEEICDVLNTSYETLNNWCKVTYGDTFIRTAKTFRSEGKTNLRRIQMQLAEKNTTMAIWLGKQYLGQTDKIEQETSETITFVSDVPKEDN